jgi:Concanavalin A-like lectin/glucanases superfamily
VPSTRSIPHLVCAFAAIVLFSNVTMAGLTHRYSFNDGTANDSVGGANGALINGATVSGGQLVFNPSINNGTPNPVTGQYVNLPSNILFTRSFTVEAWATDNSSTPWQRILDLGNTEGSGFLILVPFNKVEHPLGQISIFDHGGSSDTNFVAGSNSISVGTETEYAYVHNLSTGNEFLYINGTLVAQSVASQDPTTTAYRNFYIGRSQFSADPYFGGTIDELRTYDFGLTSAQVQSDFLAGPNTVAVPEPGWGAIGILLLSASLCIPRRHPSAASFASKAGRAGALATTNMQP